MALLLAAAHRASALPLRRATALLRQRPTLSSARAMSFWSSSSSEEEEDNEDPMATGFRTWASIREKIYTAGAHMQELRLRHALGSAVQSRMAAPVADLPGLLAQIEATTDYFPFKISENKRADAITLTRALKGEQIKVVVSMPSLDDDEDDDDGHDDDDDDNKVKNNKPSLSSSNKETKETEEVVKDTSQSTMHLEVTVSKGEGLNIKFSCLANPDKVEIYTMYMTKPTTKEDEHVDHDMATYDGFDGLNENLKKSFHEYLELRGITPKMMNLLRGYLSGKLRRKHTLWLNNLQDFVGKNHYRKINLCRADHSVP